MKNKPARRLPSPSRPDEPGVDLDDRNAKLGDPIAADHIVIGSELDESHLGDAAVMVVEYRATSAYPAPQRTAE